jgi:hypothetical protein
MGYIYSVFKTFGKHSAYFTLMVNFSFIGVGFSINVSDAIGFDGHSTLKQCSICAHILFVVINAGITETPKDYPVMPQDGDKLV